VSLPQGISRKACHLLTTTSRYVTNEFEVTQERLGCYLPTEHIDNPKGYAEGEDARQYDPRLRGPVDPRELEIDSRFVIIVKFSDLNGSGAA